MGSVSVMGINDKWRGFLGRGSDCQDWPHANPPEKPQVLLGTVGCTWLWELLSWSPVYKACRTSAPGTVFPLAVSTTGYQAVHLFPEFHMHLVAWESEGLVLSRTFPYLHCYCNALVSNLGHTVCHVLRKCFLFSFEGSVYPALRSSSLISVFVISLHDLFDLSYSGCYMRGSYVIKVATSWSQFLTPQDYYPWLCIPLVVI